MPRLSAQALAQPVIDCRRVRLIPGPELSPKAQRAFTGLVASVAAEHFSESDRPVLNALAVALVTHCEASAHVEEHGVMLPDGKPNPAAKVALDNAKLVGTLSTTLRLTPQSRTSSDKAASTTRGTEPDRGALAIRTAQLIKEGKL